MKYFRMQIQAYLEILTYNDISRYFLNYQDTYGKLVDMRENVRTAIHDVRQSSINKLNDIKIYKVNKDIT